MKVANENKELWNALSLGADALTLPGKSRELFFVKMMEKEQESAVLEKEKEKARAVLGGPPLRGPCVVRVGQEDGEGMRHCDDVMHDGARDLEAACFLLSAYCHVVAGPLNSLIHVGTKHLGSEMTLEAASE